MKGFTEVASSPCISLEIFKGLSGLPNVLFDPETHFLVGEVGSSGDLTRVGGRKEGSDMEEGCLRSYGVRSILFLETCPWPNWRICDWGAETRVTMLVLPATQPTRQSMGPERW
jgi:hypothetical protein